MHGNRRHHPRFGSGMQRAGTMTTPSACPRRAGCASCRGCSVRQSDQARSKSLQCEKRETRQFTEFERRLSLLTARPPLLTSSIVNHLDIAASRSARMPGCGVVLARRGNIHQSWLQGSLQEAVCVRMTTYGIANSPGYNIPAEYVQSVHRAGGARGRLPVRRSARRSRRRPRARRPGTPPSALPLKFRLPTGRSVPQAHARLASGFESAPGRVF